MTKHAVILLLLLLVLVFHTSGVTAQELETGWSNGMRSDGKGWKEVHSMCRQGEFIDSWIVGEANVSAFIDAHPAALKSVVSVKAKCSNGVFLDFSGSTQHELQHDSATNSALSSPVGYTCTRLVQGSYNNGGNWMMTFMGTGQELAEDAAATPIQLNCASIPSSYVAVGYYGAAGAAIDGLNFIMAPLPQQAPPPGLNLSSESNTTNAEVAAAGPESKAPDSRIVAPTDPKTLSWGAWIGIGASCFMGLSAIVTTVYSLWKWMNKHKLVLAKASSPASSVTAAAAASSGSSYFHCCLWSSTKQHLPI